MHIKEVPVPVEFPPPKYIVRRKNGKPVPWPAFVLSANDAAAPVALRAYRAALVGHADPDYIAQVDTIIASFEAHQGEAPDDVKYPEPHQPG